MRPLLTFWLALVGILCGHAGHAVPGTQPAAPLAPRTEAQVRQQLVAVAMGQVGVVEATNHNDGAQVQAFLKAVGLKGNWPWCAAFVVWCIKQVHLSTRATGAAASFFTPATRKWPGVAGAAPPQPGDVHGYRFAGHRIDHAGLVKFWGVGPMADVVEGNTSSRRANRDGQGVYEKWVLKSQIAEVADLFKCAKIL